MSDQSSATLGPVIVAVTFDEPSSNLLKSAASVAKRLSTSLHVIHCAEYWIGRSWPSNGLFPGDFGSVTAAFEEAALNRSREHLSKIVASSLPSFQGTMSVETGFPVDVIRNCADRLKASCIVLGTKEQTYRFVPKGLSTVLSLQDESPCPVLVFPTKRLFDWQPNRKLKILISDDLSPEGAHVVEKGLLFASKLEPTEITHIHVNSLQKEDLQAALQLVTASKHVPETPMSADVLWDSSMQRLSAFLKDRSLHLPQNTSTQTTLKHVILHGNPQDEIQRFTEEMDIDLLVFGRHKTIHRKPFNLGRMPLAAMSRLERPLLIIQNG
jgi:nucleotide-binding universal stress UspA family protein